jgi:tetratricopeptide (TPR) repeat protein
MATVARNREYSSELALARTIVDRWPTSANRSILGGLLASAGLGDEAEAQFRLAMEGAPRARYDLGGLLFEQGRLDESIEQLNEFVRVALSPPADHPPWQPPTEHDVIRARTLVGHAYLQREEWPKAIEQFEGALRLDGANSDAHRFLARSLRAVGRFDEAIGHYREYLKGMPADGDAWIGLGIALGATNRVEEAIAAFRRAVETSPDMLQARQNLAIALSRHGDFTEAAAELQQALERHPNDPLAHSLLGQAFESLLRIPEARAEYERALQLDPNHTPATEGLHRLASGPRLP